MGWVVIRVFAIHAENVLEIFPRRRCLPEYILFLSHCSQEKFDELYPDQMDSG